MNKNKEVYQFKLDLIQADKRYINGNYLKIGWQAYYRISNSSLYNDLALYLIYQDFDPQGKKNPHFEFSIINDRLGHIDYKLSRGEEAIYKRCVKLFKDLEGKAAKYSNTVTDQAGKKINTEFILERNSPIEKLEEFKDIANDFLQLLNETI